jgi:phytoene dehydrogenase-like protein
VRTVARMTEIAVVGGGIAGLVASIACAEGGRSVRLLEAHAQLGGRGRGSDGPYVSNFGPHVLYANGALVPFMAQRKLLPPFAKPPMTGIRFRAGARRRLLPPAAMLRAVAKLRNASAPDDVAFRLWVAERCGERAAELLSRSAGVFAFHHDPGELSAAFVWERWRTAFLDLPPKARYVRGGWTALIDALQDGARARGVRIETGARVTELPPAPVIVATELPDARALLGDDTLRWPGGRTVALDLGLRGRRGDPFAVWDLDEAGWVERFTAPDPSLAPDGHALIQAQMPLRPGESTEEGERRLDALIDLSLGDDWRERTEFRRRTLLDDRTGAVDPPGTSWRDRPAIDRGDGVFLAGDHVAASGLLSDVSVNSALAAAKGALAAAQLSGRRAEMSKL